jgi:beta-lactam-binding protein with PASTA domain
MARLAARAAALGVALVWLTAAGESAKAQSEAAREILTHRFSRATAVGVAPAARRLAPRLIGYTCAEAKALLQRLDLELICDIGTFRGSVAAGHINEQSPDASTPLVTRVMTAKTEPSPSIAAARTVAVPDLANTTVPQAMDELEKARLSGVAEPDADDPFHVVASQDPAARAQVPIHSRVVLRAVLRLEVPDLGRITCARAVRLAHGRGFDEVQCLERTDGPRDLQGRVVAQEPAPGTILNEPRLLRAYVLRAGQAPLETPPEAVPVPLVTGKTLVEAVEIVHAALLAVEDTGPSQAPELRVVDQRPSPGQMVARGSLVRLALRIEVPDFGDATCGEARDLGRKRGLPAVRCQWGVAPDGHGMTGRVFAQSVPAGEVLEAPELVLVTVARLVVPDVEGRTVAEARNALQLLRLTAVLDVADGAPRVVDDQSPDPGARANIGDAVRVTTTRLVTVPDLDGRSCAEAQRVAGGAGLGLACREERTDYSFLTPTVTWQFPDPGAVLRVGTVVQARASARVPWVPVALLTAGAAGAWILLRRFWPHLRRPRLRLRGEPDHAPSVVLRMKGPSGPGPPAVTVRGEPGPAHVVARDLDPRGKGRS